MERWPWVGRVTVNVWLGQTASVGRVLAWATMVLPALEIKFFVI